MDNKFYAKDWYFLIKFYALPDKKEFYPTRRDEMRNYENELGTNDLALVLFMAVAGWLLIFQSGLF